MTTPLPTPGSGDYNQETLCQALEQVGLKPGVTVFCHSNIGFFGVPEGGMTAGNVYETIFGAFMDVLGPQGTLVVPTFTYSFPAGKPFDVNQTPSTCGIFTEMVRKDSRAVRSEDPAYSVAAIGRKASALTKNAPINSFGPDSFFERFLEDDGLICNLNFDAGSTFIHYVERHLAAPYRYDKSFKGQIIIDGKAQSRDAVIYVTDLNNELTTAEFEPFDRLARAKEIAKTAAVGRGAVVAITARDTLALVENTLDKHPWFLTLAEKSKQIPEIKPYLSHEPYQRPAHTDLTNLSDHLSALPRLGVGPGVEASFACLQTFTDIKLHRIKTGTDLGGLLVPEAWRLQAASLQTTSGTTILDQDASAQWVPAHSRAFHGKVDRSELLKHVVTDSANPDKIITAHLIDKNQWGLSLPYSLVEKLDQDHYQVDISVIQRFSALTVGTLEIPGREPTTLLLSVSLGTDDSEALTQALQWFLNRRIDYAGQHRLVLMIYPQPFNPVDLIPSCCEGPILRQAEFSSSTEADRFINHD